MQVNIPYMDGMGRASFNVEHYFFSAIPALRSNCALATPSIVARLAGSGPQGPFATNLVEGQGPINLQPEGETT